MIRLYVSSPISAQSPIDISDKQMHYLLHVMRLKNGDKIHIFNGYDGEWETRLEIYGKKKMELMPLHQVKTQTQRTRCVLCPALIKKENMDLVLQKATELGVTEIYPLITERTVVRSFNMERAQTIIYEACEQCERNDVPILHKPRSLNQFLNSIPENLTPVHLAERTQISQTLSANITPAFLIGPEGGFTENENTYIRQIKNCYTVHLGTTVLRAETAAIAVLSAWQFRLF